MPAAEHLTFPIVGKDTSGAVNILVPWSHAKFPGAASNEAAVSVAPTVNFTLGTTAGTPGTLDDQYCKWSWTSTQFAGNIFAGSQIILGQSFICPSVEAVEVGALMKVNNTSRFKECLVEVIDADNSSNRFSVSAGLSTSWGFVIAASADTTSWGNALRMTLTIRGTDNTANVGLTEVYIAYLYAKFLI